MRRQFFDDGMALHWRHGGFHQSFGAVVSIITNSLFYIALTYLMWLTFGYSKTLFSSCRDKLLLF